MNHIAYTKQDQPYVKFNQSRTPRMLFVLFGQLDVYIHMTQSQLFPYEVQMSESEFKACLEMSKEI